MLAPLLFVVILVAARLAVGVGDEAATVRGAAKVAVVVLETRSASSGGVKLRRLAGNRRRHAQARPTLSRPNAAAFFQEMRPRWTASRRGGGGGGGAAAARAGWSLAGRAERSRFDWVRGLALW